jgi:hypothetical protein
LHGLGHWHQRDPLRFERIIDEFLRGGGMRDELRQYALQARRGNVR